jgi:hypothetical protein
MTAYSISKLFMKLFHGFSNTVKPLATLLQLALQLRLLKFQAHNRLMKLPLFSTVPKTGTLFSTVWDLNKALL